MNKTVLHISNLFLRYNDKEHNILKNLNLNVKQGEFITISGKNGSGKSTLFKAIMKIFSKGSIAEFSGSIEVLGKCSMVLQRPKSQIFTFNVLEEIVLSLSFKKIELDTRIKKGLELLTKFNFNKLRDKDPRYLSGGEQQLIVILSTLIQNPSILLLDEPCNLLDEINASYVINMLKTLNEEGVTIIIIDHRPERYDSINATNYSLDNGELSKISLEKKKSVITKKNIIELVNIEKSISEVGYNKKLFNYNQVIDSGIYYVSGPNGSGKTTLLKSLAGIIPFHKGEREEIDYFFIPHDTRLSFFQSTIFSVFEYFNLELPAHFEGISLMSPFEISEGERKRVLLEIGFEIADNIIMDEPSQSLDDENIEWLINKMNIGENQRIIFASNDIRFLNMIPYELNWMDIKK